MGLFENLFKAFGQSGPHEDLAHFYSQLNSLSSGLSVLVKELRERQERLVEQHEHGCSDGEATHRVGLQKTRRLEDSLVKKLKSLARHAERRFFDVVAEVESSGPVSEQERFELQRVVRFLEDVQSSLSVPDSGSFDSCEEELLAVESALRTVNKLCEEYYEAERFEEDVRRRVRENEFSPLLQRIYHGSEPRVVEAPDGSEHELLCAEVSRKELKSLWKESRRINAANDPKTRVVWRRPWVDEPAPEVDETLGLSDRHVNVTVKLNGNKKKIHLVVNG